jgi:hypothetical protein
MVLEGISYDEALPYLDDTCIHCKDLEGHYVAMRKVFEAYRRAGLNLQPSKCQLFQAKIEYLGILYPNTAFLQYRNMSK